MSHVSHPTPLYPPVPERPEAAAADEEEQLKDAESLGNPETFHCNGSASRQNCKHQDKRERLEKQREQLRRQQQEEENQEEQPANQQGDTGKRCRRVEVLEDLPPYSPWPVSGITLGSFWVNVSACVCLMT